MFMHTSMCLFSACSSSKVGGGKGHCYRCYRCFSLFCILFQGVDEIPVTVAKMRLTVVVVRVKIAKFPVLQNKFMGFT